MGGFYFLCFIRIEACGWLDCNKSSGGKKKKKKKKESLGFCFLLVMMQGD